MIVDDNSDVLAIVTELVSAAGYRAITASGGREAIEKAKAEMPDLMLLDINMPDIDGWSVLRSLKEEGLTSKIKVMMLTAYTDIGTDIFGLQDVVSGYIRKPFTNTELSEKIKEIVEGQETHHPGTAGGGEEAITAFSADRTQGDTGRHGEGEEDGEALRAAQRLWLRGQGDEAGEVLRDLHRPGHSQHPRACASPASIRGSSGRNGGWRRRPIIWLSNQLGRVYVNPTNIGILSDTIIRFIEKSGDSVVMLDGIEFLIVNNDFEKVLRMIHHIAEATMEYKSRLIISVDPRTLDLREMALLERNMEVIDTMPPQTTKPIR